MQLAPWLRPTDTLGAIHAGAGLGLQLRQQDAAEQNAADMLRLHEQELFAQNERARATLAQHGSDAAARLAQAQAQMGLTAGHYKNIEANQTAAQLLRTRAQQFKEDEAKRFAGMKSVTALPSMTAEGQRVGDDYFAVSGQGGLQRIKSAPSSVPTTPSSLLRFYTESTKASKDPDLSADQRATAGASAADAAASLRKILTPNVRMTPQVTTNPAHGHWWNSGGHVPESTSTNLVPSTASPPAAEALDPVPAAPPIPPLVAAARIRSDFKAGKLKLAEAEAELHKLGFDK